MNEKAWQLHVENLRLRREIRLLRNELNRERLRADLATTRLRQPPPTTHVHAPPLPKRYPRTTPRSNYNVSHHAHQPSERNTMSETEPTEPTEPEPINPEPDTDDE